MSFIHSPGVNRCETQRNLAEIRIAIQLQRRFSDRDVTIRRV